MFSIWVYLEVGYVIVYIYIYIYLFIYFNFLWVWGGSELIYKFLLTTSIGRNNTKA
jgi:hypothetical protein